MKIFHCQPCGSVLFFENTQCLSCGHLLGYAPDLRRLSAIEPLDGTRWRALAAPVERCVYRKCGNDTAWGACNWLVVGDDANELCVSCRLTRTIPDLSQPDQRLGWQRLEAAKRRLHHGLSSLDLPIVGRDADSAHGLCFDFLADTADQHVCTGHADGVITINLAEADPAAREKAKADLRESYRTLLGHLRHESGHYYWDVLIRDRGRSDACRALFGDDRQDYAEAQQSHYQQGPPADWPQRHISAYASMHPWEDWAETWAHYLHLVDVVEVGGQFAISMASDATPEATSRTRVRLGPETPGTFDQLIDAWLPLTYAINSLNRSMGLDDWYPFTLSDAVIAKLRFIHDTIHAAPTEPSPTAGP